MDAFIKQITKEAGLITLKLFGKTGVAYTKSHVNDVVTKADLLANKHIVNAIKKTYPTHSIISEETGQEIVESEYCWVIDPLDGTLNFATRVPLFGTMVALLKNNEVVLSAIYFPCTDELLFAKKGKGTFLNGKRVTCSQKTDVQSSYGLLSVKAHRIADITSGLASIDSKRTIHASAIGSAAVDALYLATGRRDWKYIRKSALWDIAAPALILKESGCIVTNTDGKPWKTSDADLFVANKYMHKKLLKVFLKATKK